MSARPSFDPAAIVAVVPCDAYDKAILRDRMNEIMQALGMEKTFFEGKKVAIKPNLVMKKPAEYAATTHPDVLDALLAYLDTCSCADVVIAESMGGPYTETALRGVYRVCGIEEAVQGHKAHLNFDVTSRPMSAPDGVICKGFDIITPIADADVIINLCKLKSHSLTRMSGAIKNTFGCIPGLTKFEFHARYPDYADFNKMLVDLSSMLHAQKECIDICDAIVGMEGNGPTGGNPRKIGCLIASRNPFCLDTVSAAMLCCEGEVPMITEAASRGYAPAHADDVNVSADYHTLIQTDFQAPDTARRSKNALHWLPKLFGGKIFDWFAPRPVIRTSTCVGCGECERSCPVHTIEMITDKNGKKKAQIHASKCIRCFCCQELCPIHSVDIRKNGILNLLAQMRR